MAAGARLGFHREPVPDAGRTERAPVDLDDLRHGAPAIDVFRPGARAELSRCSWGSACSTACRSWRPKPSHGARSDRTASGAVARTATQDPARPGRPAPGPGSSTAILGRTAGGYLLVAIFFAYDVLLYLVTTKTLGWWSPSEALLHPDVLATYAPWLSAIGNSFQAGFWEESLFRAVPIAGAALIGDRFGNRQLFIVLAFIVQAIIFGAGHAPYRISRRTPDRWS